MSDPTRQINRRVDVFRSDRPLSSIDMQGQEVPIGIVALDEFDNEGLRSMKLLPADNNTWTNKRGRSQGIHLGQGSQVDVINPADVHRLFLDAGWQMVRQYGAAGGAEIHTEFIDPENVFEDVIDWDRDFWADAGNPRGTDAVGKAHTSVSVDTSLYVGRMAVNISAGIHRLICANGMTSPLLGLGDWQFQHRSWDTGYVADTIRQNLPRFDGNISTPTRATALGIHKVLPILNRLQELRAAAESLPADLSLVSKLLTPFDTGGLHPRILRGYADQLRIVSEAKMREAGELAPISAMDLLCAYTSAVNIDNKFNPTARGNWWYAYHTDRIIDATSQLASLATLFGSN